MLEVRDLSLYYGKKPVVDRLSFTLKLGHTLALVGRSGCGKSTILAALAGVLLTRENAGVHARVCGEIYWQGRQLDLEAHQARLMLQSNLLLPWLKVVDNVALPLRLRRHKKNVARQQALDFLKQFRLYDCAWQYPSQLSGGMQQRIALLRTCIDVGAAAPLVLLDEPFSKLDPLTREECRSWAKNLLQQLTATTLLVTHDIEEAIAFADSVLVLSSPVEYSSDEVGCRQVCQIDIAQRLSAHEALDLKEKIRSFL